MMFVGMNAMATEPQMIVIHQLGCHSAKPLADKSVSVSIDRVFNPSFGNRPAVQNLVASVYENTISGPRLVMTVAVEKSFGRSSGNTENYVGKDFSLVLYPNGALVEGRFQAELSYDRRGERLAERVLCNFLR